MSVGINFETNKTFVKSRGDTKQFITNIPQVEADIANGIARDLKEAIQDSIDRKGLDYSGELKSNVRVDASKSSGGGTKFEVSANAYSEDGVNYAAWHEYAQSSHFVPFKSNNTVNQPITRWAKSKGVDDGIGITVTPLNQTEGSFMEPAVQEAISKTRKDVRTGKNPVFENLAEAYRK